MRSPFQYLILLVVALDLSVISEATSIDQRFRYVGTIPNPYINTVQAVARFALPLSWYNRYRSLIAPSRVKTYFERKAFSTDADFRRSQTVLYLSQHGLVTGEETEFKEEGLEKEPLNDKEKLPWTFSRFVEHFLPKEPEGIKVIRTYRSKDTVQGAVLYQLPNGDHVLIFRAFIDVNLYEEKDAYFQSLDVNRLRPKPFTVPLDPIDGGNVNEEVAVTVDNQPVTVLPIVDKLYRMTESTILRGLSKEQNFNPKRLIVAGYSIGGNFAEMFALRHAVHPVKALGDAKLEVMSFSGIPVFGKPLDEDGHPLKKPFEKHVRSPKDYHTYFENFGWKYTRMIAEDYAIVCWGVPNEELCGIRRQFYEHIGPAILFAHHNPPKIDNGHSSILFPEKRVVAYLREEEDFPSELFEGTPYSSCENFQRFPLNIPLIQRNTGILVHTLGLSRMVLPIGK